LSEIEQCNAENEKHCPKSNNPLSEIEQSLTEITTEINTTTTGGDASRENPSDSKPDALTSSADDTQNVYSLYEQNIGVLTNIIADRLKEHEQEYGAFWVAEAIIESVANNVRSLRYIETILSRWHREGFKSDNRRQRKGKPNGKTTTSRAGAQNAAADPNAERENIERIKRRKQRQRGNDDL